MSAVAVPAVNQSGVPTNYFRIHDTLLDRPTGAIAYPHWTGKVDFALQYEQVPKALHGPTVGELQQAKYAVTCRVSDEASLQTAEELLFLSLEHLRETAAGT
ncbi:hypothetical protein EV138_4975 [Kribbella voronezhensis]|uniref:Uncharacterized protein n=1 Tax=Kribbella voronezhensis TaxID=2512212 RepID=A0A4R7THN1_9ACTN|nr:hypothetical protein [Kribbella voronezhensis]TDU91369.1 hypothetical protein EV138_4975 [Kribbella voronezhensis]